jgi:nitric oxide reductase NorE protein
MIKKDILNPPGGLMIWIFSLSEIFVFLCAIASFLYQKQLEPELFLESRLRLNQLYATLNTLLLITSSYFVVCAVEANDCGNKKKTLTNLVISTILGVTFLIVKSIEYSEKASANFVLGSNTFFDYYWILTAFHAIHVFIGIFILLWLLYYTYNDIEFKEQDLNFHTGANYWHLCDLIWLIIFPVLYLL